MKDKEKQYLTPKQLRDAANAPRCSASSDDAWPGDRLPPDRHMLNFESVWVDHPTLGLYAAVRRVKR